MTIWNTHLKTRHSLYKIKGKKRILSLKKNFLSNKNCKFFAKGDRQMLIGYAGQTDRQTDRQTKSALFDCSLKNQL